MARNLAVLALAAALLLGAACSRSPRVTYYNLTPGGVLPAAVQQPFSSSVVVGPVTIPEVVNRPQLVVRQAPNRVAVLESHRWAEPLKDELPRLMAEDVGRLLGSSRVFAYGQNSGASAQYRVLVDIIRLEAAARESVTLEASWVVRGAGSYRREGRARVREQVTGSGYEAVAAALSRAVAGVSAEIARTVRGANSGAR